MSDNLLKFVLFRPPIRASKKQQHYKVIQPYANELSPLAQELSQQTNLKIAREIAKAYIASESFVSRLEDLENGGAIVALDQWLLDHKQLEPQLFREAISRYFPHIEHIKKILTALYRDIFRLSDSLLAIVVRRKYVPSQEVLARGLRICHLIKLMGSARITETDLQQALQAPILLPTLGLKLKSLPQAETTQPTAEISQVISQQVNLANELNAIQKVIDELISVYSTHVTRLQQGTTSSDPPSFFRAEDFETLSPSSKAILKDNIFPFDIISTIHSLENKISSAAESLTMPLQSAVSANIELPFLFPVQIPGAPYSPSKITPIPATPINETSGIVRRAGIGELLIVRQKIKKYELGEIAHIENVMIGEAFSRTFKRQEGTETTELMETESTQTTERDLQTTSKYELKNEIEKSIKEDISVEAGVTLTARGPSIEVGADARFEYDRVTEEATKTAITYSHEVVDRSISRIQERALERRSIRTTRSIEETSTHTLKNDSTEAHVVGIYRWVDKVYEAQVVNYGKRMILEIVVPEPAAFYLFSQIHKTSTNVTAVEPEPPLVLDMLTHQPRPLLVTDITEANYLLWTSKYNVTGITPPPSHFRHSSCAIKLEKESLGSSGPEFFAIVSALPEGSIKVEAGYVATEFNHVWQRQYISGTRPSSAFVQIGGVSFRSNDTNTKVAWPAGLEGSVPVSIIGRQVPAAVSNIIVTSQRTRSALDTWKIATFNAIIAKYERLKAEFDDQMAAASVQAGVQIRGKNPLSNRDIERNELKKLGITMMTGQHFDAYKAMKGPDTTHIFPQIDVLEADEAGSYIQFLEQAIEWQYMTYVFYPYFWARKSRWIDMLNIEDVDPLFRKFLQAGSARLQIPIRPGFEKAVDFFLATGQVWLGGDPPHIQDGSETTSELPFISITQEIQEQTGLDFVPGPGTISVTQGDVTVTGEGTDFRRDDEGVILGTMDREIKIVGQVYRVRAVASANEITLSNPYEGATQSGLTYSLGARLVGESWEVKLPTTLVILQGKEAELNYPNDLPS